MIRFFKIVFVFIMSLTIFSCNKAGDDPAEAYVVPYTEQYPVDLAAIDKYLDEYHMDVSSNKDVTFTKIPTPNTANLQTIRVQYALDLHTKTVNSNGVDYKVYYVNISDTSDPEHDYYGDGENPTSVDSIFVSYKGEYIYTKKEEIVPATNPITYNSFIASTPFDQAQNPVWIKLYQYVNEDVIRGWKEIFPLFKSGTHTANLDGSVNYDNYGSGVMFLPSALAYYNSSRGSIPSYSPLIFSFKLNTINYVDHDYDGIDSKDEGFDLITGQSTNLDTDGDGRLNYLDQDDDGDSYLTKFEIKKPTPFLGTSLYYPFSPIADNPATPTIDESEPKGIPSASGDGVTTTRLRRHLDRNSHPPFTTY
jgi:FKBP-type peptidyl-prolyl cis-trans isomerase FkpA